MVEEEDELIVPLVDPLVIEPELAGLLIVVDAAAGVEFLDEVGAVGAGAGALLGGAGVGGAESVAGLDGCDGFAAGAALVVAAGD